MNFRLLALALLFALAQGNPTSGQSNEGWLLAGRVVDLSTGQPIRGALIEVANGREGVVVGAPDGEFSFQVRTPRPTGVRVYGIGWYAWEREFGPSERTNNVTAFLCPQAYHEGPTVPAPKWIGAIPQPLSSGRLRCALVMTEEGPVRTDFDLASQVVSPEDFERVVAAVLDDPHVIVEGNRVRGSEALCVIVDEETLFGISRTQAPLPYRLDRATVCLCRHRFEV